MPNNALLDNLCRFSKIQNYDFASFLQNTAIKSGERYDSFSFCLRFHHFSIFYSFSAEAEIAYAWLSPSCRNIWNTCSGVKAGKKPSSITKEHYLTSSDEESHFLKIIKIVSITLNYAQKRLKNLYICTTSRFWLILDDSAINTSFQFCHVLQNITIKSVIPEFRSLLHIFIAVKSRNRVCLLISE